jgi:3-hydroxyacyl-CoA dehydrogenase
MSTVHYTATGDVAVLTIDNPPVNALNMAIRGGLLEAVRRAMADAAIKAVVVIAAGKTFVAGADIKEFGQPMAGPSLLDTLAALEASSKPVVAALHGTALGGGLELALGCHWRVALASVKVGLPEVNLGIIPGAGGTQRLPRLIGPAKALDMITTGKPVDGRSALALGIVDELIDGDLLDGALAFARKVVAEQRPLRIAGQLQDKVSGVDPALFADLRKKMEKKWRGLVAPWKIVEAVENACKLPFAEGARLERAAYLECQASPQRKAQTHLFMAERAAAKIPGLPSGLKPVPIRSAAIIGAGTMGGGIAMCFANAGIPVRQVEMTAEALARGRGIIEKNYATSLARGSITQEKMDRSLALIQGTLDYADIADCDIVIEAAFEDLAIKQDIFRKLDTVMKPGAILATNTSTLDIDKIAAVTARPGSVIGTHFFSPANVMKLLENVRGAHTSGQTIASAMAMAKSIGKVAVLAGNCDGFIGNRILHVYGRECDFLLEEGATPWQVDRALQGYGFPMGLYLMRDMAGLDVGWRIRQYREAFRDKSLRYSPIADRLCERGRFGQKTGAGYYRYEGRDATPDPDVEQLIEATSKELGIARAPVSDEEIVTRVLCALVNEGAKLLDEGIAMRAGDIDVTYVCGYGFPAYRGGPMFWAEQEGLAKVLEHVKRFHAAHGKLWTPSPLLERLAASGGGWDAAALPATKAA